MRKKHPNRILFSVGTAEVVALAMAKVGASDRAIQQKCNLSSSQISYRLRKAKDLEQRDQGYRIAYRNGDSPEFKRIMRDHLAIIKADIERVMPRLIVHTPLGSNGNGK